MPMIDLDYGEIEMGLAFIKMIRGQLPADKSAMRPQALELARYIYENSSEEGKDDIRKAGLAPHQL